MFKRLLVKREDLRSATLVDSYQKTVFWGRLMLASFFAVYTVTLLWTIPWFPYGLSTQDYNERTAPLILLLLFASTTAFAAVYLRDRKRRLEQTLLTWNSVHDGLSDLRRREYFYDRIVIECERAQARRSQFTVAVLKIGWERASPDAQQVSKALAALEPMVKEMDCLASISHHEIGVLAPLITERDAEEFTRRLRLLVSGALRSDDDSVRVEAAHAVFNRDATDAGELVGIARSRNLSGPAAGDVETAPGLDYPTTAV